MSKHSARYRTEIGRLSRSRWKRFSKTTIKRRYLWTFVICVFCGAYYPTQADSLKSTAGSTTTAGVLKMAVVLVATNPHVLNKLVTELDEAEEEGLLSPVLQHKV